MSLNAFLPRPNSTDLQPRGGSGTTGGASGVSGAAGGESGVPSPFVGIAGVNTKDLASMAGPRLDPMTGEQLSAEQAAAKVGDSGLGDFGKVSEREQAGGRARPPVADRTHASPCASIAPCRPCRILAAGAPQHEPRRAPRR